MAQECPGKMGFGHRQPDLRCICYQMFILSVGNRCLGYHLNGDRLLFFFFYNPGLPLSTDTSVLSAS